MGFKERGKILRESNYLDLHPIRLIDFEQDEKGLLTLIIPKFENKFFVKYFVPYMKSPNVKLKLDELGSAAWLAIDGKKSVEEISNELTVKFGEKIQPAEERLTSFLSQLYEQRIITFEEIKGV
ncbi:MAG: hypothetical protein Fur0015_15170 [Ignavibacteriales bacterium]